MTDGSRSLDAMPGWVREVARFIMVGGAAAVVDFGVLWLGIQAGLSPPAARVPALAIAVCFTWWFNRKLTFRTQLPPSWREFAHYVGVAMAGVPLTLLVYWTALWAGAAVWFAFVLSTGFTAVFSFLRYRVILGRS